MKKYFLFIFCQLIVFFPVHAQTPTVYCTYWNGTSEYLAYLNFTTHTVDLIGEIPGSTSFPVASANGYDAYRNRYYTISNQGLVAIDAVTGIPVFTAAQFAGSFKHLSYNPTTDLLFATRYNGSAEEFYQISPETFNIVNQGILDIGNPFFAVGFYGSDSFANEVIFQTSETSNNIKTVNIATGAVTRTFTKPAYMANVLLAAHDPLTDQYYATGIRNTQLYLLQINKLTNEIDTVGRIPGATSIALTGSAIDMVNRTFIFVSNLGITIVSLNNPSNTTTIPYPAGVSNVKGFQTNAFSAPIPRLQGSLIRAQFKKVENWWKDGIAIPGSATPDFAPVESGTYRYTVRRPDGTESLSSEISFSVTSGNRLDNKQILRAYTDVANEKLILQNGNSESVEVKIFSMEGRCMKSGKPDHNQVDIRTLPAGVYQVQIQLGSQTYRTRFLKP